MNPHCVKSTACIANAYKECCKNQQCEDIIIDDCSPYVQETRKSWLAFHGALSKAHTKHTARYYTTQINITIKKHEDIVGILVSNSMLDWNVFDDCAHLERSKNKGCTDR